MHHVIASVDFSRQVSDCIPAIIDRFSWLIMEQVGLQMHGRQVDDTS